jgi:hypothetical protein
VELGSGDVERLKSLSLAKSGESPGPISRSPSLFFAYQLGWAIRRVRCGVSSTFMDG